jgi:hypothetical protein
MLAGGQRFMASRPGLMARGQRLMGARQRLNWTYVLALILLVVVGVLGFLLVDSSGHAPSSTQAASGSRHPGRVSGRGRPNPGPTAARTTSPGSASPGLPLSPVSATAFGPGGTGQGDNPQLAPLVISGGAWHTDWYSTATFGNIQAGTGLLLDMGRPVTITAAQMTLDGSPGASLQLRAGNTPTLANLPPVAGASNAGGALQLNFSKPVTCRYVLIWFTGLPPDPAGTFQASVSDVRLKGMA